MADNSARAVIENGAIVIRVPMKNLQSIVDGAWMLGGVETRYKVSDPGIFVQDLVRALNEEDEQGTTTIHNMFDAAINKAIEDGADGIYEHEDQDE